MCGMSTFQPPNPVPGSPWNAPSGSAYPGATDLPPAVRRPGTVEAAFWIYLVSAVLTFAATLLVFTAAGQQAIRDAVRQGVQTRGVNEDQLIQTAQIIAVVVGLIIVAIALLFVFKMRAGRNWARVVLTVFGVLSLLSLFSGVRTGTSTPDFIGPIVTLVALVLMWLPASNEYFAAAKRRRAAEIARG